jgi:hypothetical protein
MPAVEWSRGSMVHEAGRSGQTRAHTLDGQPGHTDVGSGRLHRCLQYPSSLGAPNAFIIAAFDFRLAAKVGADYAGTVMAGMAYPKKTPMHFLTWRRLVGTFLVRLSPWGAHHMRLKLLTAALFAVVVSGSTPTAANTVL